MTPASVRPAPARIGAVGWAISKITVQVTVAAVKPERILAQPLLDTGAVEVRPVMFELRERGGTVHPLKNAKSHISLILKLHLREALAERIIHRKMH